MLKSAVMSLGAPAKPPNSGMIVSLTGLRAVAAMLVFWHHMLPLEPNISWFGGFLAVLREGHIGVTLFFVLSGFLITYRYSTIQKLDKSWYYGYWVNRIARIYPVFVLFSVISLLWKQSQLSTWILNLTLLKGFSRGYLFSGIAQSWSLTVEECFYLVAPLLFLLIGRYGLRILPIVSFVLLAVGLLLSALRDWALASGLSWIDYFWGNYTFTIYYTFLGRSVEFFLGVYAAKIVAKGSLKATFPTLFTFIGTAGILGSMCLLAMLAEPKSYGIHTWPGMMANNYLLPCAVVFLIIGLVVEETWLKRMLSLKPFIVAGKASYVFYLLHIGSVSYFFNRTLVSLHIRSWAITMLWLGVCWLLSVGIYTLYEHPMNTWIKAKFAPR